MDKKELIEKLDSITPAQRWRWLKALMNNPVLEYRRDALAIIMDEYSGFYYSRRLFIATDGKREKFLALVLADKVKVEKTNDYEHKGYVFKFKEETE